MKYLKTVTLKNGKELLLRSCNENDAREVLDVFNTTHEETDYLLSYPNEKGFTLEDEAEFLKMMDKSENETEILAFLDGKLVGTAGISSVGQQLKIKHRAEFGISVLKDYWGLGIGYALTEAVIECAETAGCLQLELEVVADNSRAISLYKKFGFNEFGRNPRGFKNKAGEFQELVYMRFEL